MWYLVNRVSQACCHCEVTTLQQVLSFHHMSNKPLSVAKFDVIVQLIVQ